MLEKFLIKQARTKLILESYDVEYREDVNPDAVASVGNNWLTKGTSYIWKVGVLTLIDQNKCDFVHVFIGHKRSKEHECEFIGELYWRDGENDDIGRSLRRYVKLLNHIHPVFQDE